MEITVLFFAGLMEKTGTRQTKLHFDSSSISLLEIIKRLVVHFAKLTEVFFPKIPQDQIDEYLSDEVDFHITRVKFARNRKIISHTTHQIHFTDGDTLAIFLPLIGG